MNRSVHVLLEVARGADRFLRERTRTVIAIVSVVYLAITCLYAAATPLWFDELFTYYISRLGTVGEAWDALTTGDPNPPLQYLLTRSSNRLFGDSALATRLPSIAGFSLMSLALFAYARRRLGPTYAFPAAILVWISGAYQFSLDARPYALLLGLCGAAYWFWQAASEPQRRLTTVFGLWLTTAMVFLTHCYSVLFLVPMAAAEIDKLWRRRKPDFAVWLAILAALPATICYIPLLRGAAAVHGATWARPELEFAILSYGSFLDAAYWAPMAAVFLFASRIALAANPQPPRAGSRELPRHELVFLVTLALVPAIATVAAHVLNIPYYFRYAIFAVIGISLLGTVLLGRMSDYRSMAGAVLAVMLFALFFVMHGAGAYGRMLGKGISSSVSLRPATLKRLLITRAVEPVPIVVSDGRMFLQAAHYAPAELAGRIVYLTDRRLAIAYSRTDSVDAALLALAKHVPLKLEPYGEFVASHKQFYVFAPPDSRFDWLMPALRDRALSLHLTAREEHDGLPFSLFLVSTNGSSPLKSGN